MAFKFMSGYVDRVAGYNNVTKIMAMNMSYSKLLGNLCSDSMLCGITDEWIELLRKKL